MIIRKANYHETNYILDLSPSLMEESTIGYMKSDPQKMQEFTIPFLQNGGYYLIAVDQNRILGWILLGSNVNSFKDEEVGFLFDLYIFKPFRRYGVAKRLMSEALNQLKNAGYKKVQLNIFAGNIPSRTLCEQFGFKDVSTLFERKI